MNFTHPDLQADRAFGRFEPSGLRAALLEAANTLYPDRKGGLASIPRFFSSASRKAALAGTDAPVDRVMPWGHKARLYGRDNTTDKYLMYGIEPVHAVELQAMAAIASRIEGPVSFLDIGGNSGLYTLQAWQHLAGSGAQIGPWLCVEPNPMMRARLSENLAMNNLTDATMVDCALSDRDGEIEMETDFSNLGKVRIPLDGAKARKPLKVQMTTLAKMLATFDQGTPDIVKVDIEGHEQVMFEAFWHEAPEMRPKLIILEMWRGKEDEQTACMERGGYRFVAKPSENAVFLHASEADLPALGG